MKNKSKLGNSNAFVRMDYNGDWKMIGGTCLDSEGFCTSKDEYNNCIAQYMPPKGEKVRTLICHESNVEQLIDGKEHKWMCDSDEKKKYSSDLWEINYDSTINGLKCNPKSISNPECTSDGHCVDEDGTPLDQSVCNEYNLRCGCGDFKNSQGDLPIFRCNGKGACVYSGHEDRGGKCECIWPYGNTGDPLREDPFCETTTTSSFLTYPGTNTTVNDIISNELKLWEGGLLQPSFYGRPGRDRCGTFYNLPNNLKQMGLQPYVNNSMDYYSEGSWDCGESEKLHNCQMSYPYLTTPTTPGWCPWSIARSATQWSRTNKIVAANEKNKDDFAGAATVQFNTLPVNSDTGSYVEGEIPRWTDGWGVPYNIYSCIRDCPKGKYCNFIPTNNTFLPDHPYANWIPADDRFKGDTLNYITGLCNINLPKDSLSGEEGGSICEKLNIWDSVQKLGPDGTKCRHNIIHKLK